VTAAQAQACEPWYRVLLMALKLQRTVGTLQPPVLGPRNTTAMLDLELVLVHVVAAATEFVRLAEHAAGVTPGGGAADG
jgi:hypothetical protein